MTHLFHESRIVALLLFDPCVLYSFRLRLTVCVRGRVICNRRYRLWEKNAQTSFNSKNII
jgi:hypothetical protein